MSPDVRSIEDPPCLQAPRWIVPTPKLGITAGSDQAYCESFDGHEAGRGGWLLYSGLLYSVKVRFGAGGVGPVSGKLTNKVDLR
jgi:hypothetical protein